MASYLVHEWVDERIGDVVSEIEVEDNDVVWNKTERHEECRQECDDKDNGDDEQHGRSAQVGDHGAVRRLRSRRHVLLLLCRLWLRAVLHTTLQLYRCQSLLKTGQKSRVLLS